MMNELAGLPSEARPKGERRMVDLTGASWNQIANWLRQLAAVERNEPAW